MFIKKLQQFPLIVALFIALGVFLGLFALQANRFLQPLELVVYDFFLWQRAHQPIDESRIVMVLANDADQRQWGWPLSDTLLTQLLKNLLAQQPQVIGLDLYRDLPVPPEGGRGYQQLNQLFQSNERIIAIMKYRDQHGARVDPPLILAQKGQVGFNDIPVDANGVVRRGLLYMGDEQGNVLEFFGLKLVLHYLAPLGIQPQADPEDPSALLLGQARLTPIDSNFGGYVDEDVGGFQIMLTYPGLQVPFDTLTVTEVLNRQFNSFDFKDKIIIIGVAAEATPDFIYSPFSLWSQQWARYPGAVIHGYMIRQLVRQALGLSQPIHSGQQLGETSWLLFWSLLGALLGLWTHSLWRFSMVLFGGLLILLLSAYVAFMSVHYWLLTATPALAWISTLTLMLTYLTSREKKQRSDLMLILGKHVSKDVANHIWAEREDYLKAGRLRSHRLTATLLFTDLQNFTTVSEQMQPQQLIDWLNEYMEVMVNIVEAHNGQVNKFIGDAIMAVFGVPIPSHTAAEKSRDAINAVDCALAMRQAMEQLRQKWQAEQLPQIRMRVGIFTGPVIVGSLGGKDRQEYAILGDTVNTASRLESFDKTVDADSACRILIGDATRHYLANQFQTEVVGEVSLKGKQIKIMIYKVIGRITPEAN